MAKIGIDVDGVLADYVGGYNALAKQELGVELEYPAQTWNWHEHGLAGAGYDGKRRQEAIDRLTGIIHATPFQGTLLPLTGALDALERLNELSTRGHDIYFITARTGKLAKLWTEMWLKFHGMALPTVIISKDKGRIAKALGLDVFVDDHPGNCEAVKTKFVNYMDLAASRVYLIAHPYNEWVLDEFDPERRFGFRVKNLNEVLDREFPREVRAA